MPAPEHQVASDAQEILAHIHSIFQAYLEKDRQTILDTHAHDWRGFTVSADRLLRGIDEYIDYADSVLANTTPLGYDILDTDVQVYGDLAVVYYLACYTFASAGEERTVHLRSIDVYRRTNGHWIQCGSNICTLPSDTAETLARPRELSSAARAALLEARERVWRAWFANDAEALQRLVPPEAIAIDPGVGGLADREEIIDRAASFARKGNRLVRLEFPETRIQAFGRVAILYTGYVIETEDSQGNRETTAGRGTEVFVLRDGEWLNAGWHLDSGV